MWGVDFSKKSWLAVESRAEMCSGSEAGSYLRLIDFVYHSTLGLRVIQKKSHGRGRPLMQGLLFIVYGLCVQGER